MTSLARANIVPDFKSILNLLLTLLIPYIINGIISWHISKKWDSRKTKLGISCFGLLATGVTIVLISLNGIITIFSTVGLIWPFITPMLVSTSNLPENVITYFGNFTSFFTLTCIAGVLGVTVGIWGIKKILEKKFAGYSFYV